jgi:hypothetical protein
MFPFLFLLILLVSFLGYCLAIKLFFDYPVETTFFLVVAAQVILLYVAGLAQILLPMAYALHGIGLILFVYCIARQRKLPGETLKQFLTPGSVLFVIFFFIFWINNRYHWFIEYNDLALWGQKYKYLYLYDHFIGKGHGITHSDYMPGTALLQYYFAKLIGPREGTASFAQSIFNLSIIIGLLRGIKWKQSIIAAIAFLLTSLVIHFFNFTFGTLVVDVLLGLLFGYGIAGYFASDRSSWKTILYAIFVMAVLPMVKNIGVLLSFFIGITIVIDLVYHHLIFKGTGSKNILHEVRRLVSSRNFILAIAGLIIPFLLLISWYTFLKLNQVTASHFRLHSIQDILTSFSILANESDKTTISHYLLSLDQTKISFANLTAKQFVLVLTLLGSLIGLFIYNENEQEKRDYLKTHFLFIVFVLAYLIVFLFLYLYWLPEYTRINTRMLHRYFSTFLVGWVVVLVYYLIRPFTQGNIFSNKSKMISQSILILVTMAVLYFTPISHYLEIEYQPAIRQRVSSMVEKIRPYLKEDSKTYIIWQKTDGFEYYVVRYELYPLETNAWGRTLGSPYKITDAWSTNYSAQQWMDILHKEKYDYVFVVNSDDSFWSNYGVDFKSYNSANVPQFFSVGQDSLIPVQ